MKDKEQELANDCASGDVMPVPSAASGPPTSPTRPFSHSNWVIVPVSIPGVGKGSVASALAELFKFQRVSTSGAPSCNRVTDGFSEEPFELRVLNALKISNVVYADRHNHLKRDRASFRAIPTSMERTPNLLALIWEIDSISASTLHTICLHRVRQFLPGSAPQASEIISSYLRQFELPSPDEYDACIRLRLDEDVPAMVSRVIRGLVEILHVEEPNPTQLLQATLAALRHRPSVLRPARLSIPVVAEAAYTRATPADLPTLIVSMHECEDVQHRSFTSPGGQTLVRWSTRKTAFYNVPCTLPTLVCGLCTVLDPGGGDNSRIVQRGYDKIFDIDEVPWTTWKSLERYMVGPFHLTAKLDGFLIMVSALSSHEVLVTSRRSFGVQAPRNDSHASAAESWMARHLASVNKSRADLAQCLAQHGWTLMFELLDDALEERVLDRANGKRGLHLHGINDCAVTLKTLDPAAVARFAKEWGFVPTPCESLDTLQAVQDTVYEFSASGTWHDMPVEGIVVHATVGPSVDAIPPAPAALPCPPPYAPGNPFLFKVIFSHYKLHYAYREIAKAALGRKDLPPVEHVTNLLRERDELKAFDVWIKHQIKIQALFLEGVSHRRGLNGLITRFRHYLRTPEGESALNEASLQDQILTSSGSRVHYGSDDKWLILLVGLPACGKTTLSRLISLLFGFKHLYRGAHPSTSAKREKGAFSTSISFAFKKNKIVIADDGHCHLAARRKSLIKATSPVKLPRPKTLAVCWLLADSPISQWHCSQRLLSRDVSRLPVESDCAIRRAAAEFETLQPSEVDAIITMAYAETLEQSLGRLISGLVKLLGIRPPSQSEIHGAIQEGVPPHLPKHTRPLSIPISPTSARAYALSLEMDVPGLLQACIGSANDASLSNPWDDVLSSPISKRLIYLQPRVTVLHPKQQFFPPEERALLQQQCAAISPDALFCLSFEELVYNRRIIAAKVSTIRSSTDDSDAAQLVGYFTQIGASQFHIVLARANLLVSPHEAVALLNTTGTRAGSLVVKLPGEVHAMARLHPIASAHRPGHFEEPTVT